MARCEPGVCEFSINGVIVKTHSEHIKLAIKEEVNILKSLIGSDIVAWESDHFWIMRKPGFIVFAIAIIDDTKRDKKYRGLGAIIVLPQWFVQRLEQLKPEEQQKLLRWVLRHLSYVCPGMIVFGSSLVFRDEEYEEMEGLINTVGKLEAIDLAYAQDLCSIDDIYCSISETKDYRYGTVEWLAYEPFRRGHDCTFVLLP